MKWILPENTEPPTDYIDALGGHPLTARIIYNRGHHDINDALSFIDPDRYIPANSFDLPDLDIAIDRLRQALELGEDILIWGDFDVDGQTATALLVDGLRQLGGKVAYHIPERQSEGHGIAIHRLEDYLRGQKQYHLVLTCDTGITAFTASNRIRDAGIDLIITDHHALGHDLPDALAIISNQRLPENHPMRSLPGVGVAFILISELLKSYDRESESERLLDLLALGIVADVVEQKADTRYWLQRGLQCLKYPQRSGLRALFQFAQVDTSRMSSETIGFQIAPRLNALGRLAHADIAVELLTTTDEGRAIQIASQLDGLNNRRKSIENQVYGAALEQLNRHPDLLDHEALVLAGPGWHPGVNGIVASRLVEQYMKPAIVMNLGEDGIARGSARSIGGVNIGKALEINEDMLIKHGGHEGAAGMSIDETLIPKFRILLSKTIVDIRDPSHEEGIPIDAIIGFDVITTDVLEDLQRIAPFGAGNPPLRFLSKDLKLIQQSTFGQGGSHLRMKITGGDEKTLAAIRWRGGEKARPPESLDMVYTPKINDYKGNRSLQLEYIDSRPSMVEDIPIHTEIIIHDLRDSWITHVDLPKDTIIWGENVKNLPDDLQSEEVLTRETITRGKHLTFLTSPPGPEITDFIISTVNPFTITVLALPTDTPEPEAFLKRFGALIKYALSNYEGRVRVSQLASLMGQKETTIITALDYLTCEEQIRWSNLNSGEIAISEVKNSNRSKKQRTSKDALELLDLQLKEAASYRRFFSRVNIEEYLRRFCR